MTHSVSCWAARAAALLVLSTTISACVERGDFGRVKPSVWNDAVAATGSVAALGRSEPLSSHLPTNDEAVLRDRAWRFLVPAHERAYFDRMLAELVATRILPAEAADPDPKAYHDALLASARTSPSPLYRRLSEDVTADTRLIPVFVATASRVLSADRFRLGVLKRIDAPTADEIADTYARVAENRCLIAWVASAAEFRARSYVYAMERLAIGSPQRDAAAVERAIAAYVATKGELSTLGVGPVALACAGSRDAWSGPVEPLVRKG